jgi:hypothetical protein
MPQRPPEYRAVLCLAALLGLGALLGWVLPPGPWFRAGVLDKALAWDGANYERIALGGYIRADAVTGALVPSRLVALFPGWPLVEAGLIGLAGSAAGGRGLAMVVSGAAGIASLFAFARLARDCLDAPAASRAVWLYALYPGAHFLFQPYPTAAMQVLSVLALRALLARRVWRAAALAGLATLFGPLMAFASAAIPLAVLADAWRTRSWRRCLSVPVLGVLALSGLLLFMLWQARTFGDPFAFVAAGQTWETPMRLPVRAGRALALAAVFPDLAGAALRLVRAARLAGNGDLSQAQISFEDAMDLGVVFLMSVGALAALRLRTRLPALAALLSLAGFIWFAGAPQGGQAAIRLLYPVLGGLLGLAWLGACNNTFAVVLPWVFAVILVLNQAFMLAGYWVV